MQHTCNDLNGRQLSVPLRGTMNVRFWVCSDLGHFSQFQSVLHVYPEIMHRAVKFSVAEQA